MWSDHIIAMRRILPVLLMLAVAGCAATMRWDKPGATDEAVVADMAACRQAATQEANRYSPWGFYGPPIWGRRGSVWWWQMDSERFYTENRLTAFCMRTKGYEQVPVQSTPRTQAPPVPSPEPPLPK